MNLENKVKNSLIIRKMRNIRHRLKSVDLTDESEGGPEDAKLTILVVTQGSIAVPNANSTLRLGYCRAFAKLGLRYRIVTASSLGKELSRNDQALVWMAAPDFADLSNSARKKLRTHKHCIWVQASAEGHKLAYDARGLPYTLEDEKLIKAAMDSEATFYYSISPKSYFEEFYSHWTKNGPLYSVPLACDDARYFPEPGNKKYSEVEMAFVGGYWKKKSFNFEKFLRPYERKLTVFGYSKWPYENYQGQIGIDDERVLYQNARLSPSLSEPHAEINGDITERCFKVMGSGGLTITDLIPGYYELFSKDEILVPENEEHYHYLVQKALNDEDFNQKYRKLGFNAVRERHTYIHRAKQMLELFGEPIDVK